MALDLLVIVLAAARLTRIVTTDTITASWRLRVFKRFPPENSPRRGPAHPIGQLVDCPWCIGYWISGAVVLVAALVRPTLNGIVWPLIVWQAVAWAQAIISTKLDD